MPTALLQAPSPAATNDMRVRILLDPTADDYRVQVGRFGPLESIVPVIDYVESLGFEQLGASRTARAGRSTPTTA